MLRIRDVESAFTGKLGAEVDRSGDHVYFYLEYGGSEYTVGKLSHSWRADLNDSQISLLAHKLRLKKQEFQQFVDCTLDASKTIELWQGRRPKVD